MRLKLNNKGQTLVEYVLIISLIIPLTFCLFNCFVVYSQNNIFYAL